jgi:glycosyltransferase involved in cell wall biosynthesis
MADEMKQIWGIEPIVCYQGVPKGQPALNARAPLQVHPLRLISVCRLETNKRINWILEALHRCSDRQRFPGVPSDWHLDIVGDGSLRGELAAISERLGLADRVVFHGFVDEATLQNLYADANICLMPAVQGYGLPALEALDRRIPVLLHRDSGVAEILENSPWAKITRGGVEELTTDLAEFMETVAKATLNVKDLPNYPTDEEWALNVCRQCGWIEGSSDKNSPGPN